MNTEPIAPLSDKPKFCASVELIPPPPLLIEFVGNGQVWGFPLHLLYHFSFGDNPEYNAKETRPPDQLILDYPTAAVTLLGWRLDMMLEPLCSGRVARVRAVPDVIAGLTSEEPWVTEIHVREVAAPATTNDQPTKPSAVRKET